MSATARAMHDTAPPSAAHTAGWVVLAIGGQHLALAQRDVRLMELVADLTPPTVDTQYEIGWLARKNDEPWPVYCLDDELRLQRQAPAARRVCVFVATDTGTIGIACDRVQSLALDADLAVDPVPGCMTGVPSPIAGFARHKGGITAVLSPTALAGYIAFLQEQRHDAHE
jgi:hypothetical protein